MASARCVVNEILSFLLSFFPVGIAWRGEAQGDFTAEEMAPLGRLHPHRGTALNRLTKATLNATQPIVLKLARGNLIGDLEAAPPQVRDYE